MDVDKESPGGRVWRRLKHHFTESFSGDLLSPNGAGDARTRDEWRERRQRNAFRYILLLLAAVLVPLVIHNFVIDEPLLAWGTLGLLCLLLLNIAMLGIGRDILAAPRVTQTFAVLLILFALYRGLDYYAYLLFPVLAGLPVLVRPRWSVGLAVFGIVAGAYLAFPAFETIAMFVFALGLGLTWLISYWQIFVLDEQARRLKGMAITDALTGIYNRRYFELRAETALENWERYRRPVALLLIDIDYFKRANDKFGHAAGDRVLRSVVDLMSTQVRRVDTLCRFGGEEFVLLLSEADGARALEVAEKLRQSVEGASILPEGRMTISIGVCDVAEANNVEHWLKLADAALYLAKKNGRNRAELATAHPVAVEPIAKTVPDWR